MIDLETYLFNRFQQINDVERFNHILRVKDVALEIANFYKLDIPSDKIIKASLLHDFGKLYSREILKDLIIKKGYEEDVIKASPIWHSLVGYDLYLKETGDKYEKDIENAVKNHTIGSRDMDLLSKIIFIADYIEPTRSFESAKQARLLAYIDLDKTIEYILQKTIEYLKENNKYIYHGTIDTYNYFYQLNHQKKEI